MGAQTRAQPETGLRADLYEVYISERFTETTQYLCPGLMESK